MTDKPQSRDSILEAISGDTGLAIDEIRAALTKTVSTPGDYAAKVHQAAEPLEPFFNTIFTYYVDSEDVHTYYWNGSLVDAPGVLQMLQMIWSQAETLSISPTEQAPLQIKEIALAQPEDNREHLGQLFDDLVSHTSPAEAAACLVFVAQVNDEKKTVDRIVHMALGPKNVVVGLSASLCHAMEHVLYQVVQAIKQDKPVQDHLYMRPAPPAEDAPSGPDPIPFKPDKAKRNKRKAARKKRG